MSKRKKRRQAQKPEDQLQKARERAEAAIAAGDAKEAEIWTRIANRLREDAEYEAARVDQDGMTDEEVRLEFVRRIEEHYIDMIERSEIARAYDCIAWDAMWNEIRAEQGLEPLLPTPLPPHALVLWAKENEYRAEDEILTRTLLRAYNRDLVEPDPRLEPLLSPFPSDEPASD